MWVLMIALASCQDVAEQPAQIEPVTFDPRYPSLHAVPARPQLSYTIEQKRAIVDMLIADRANARYTGGVVRYRAGLSGEPPAAPPELAAVAPEPEPGTPDAGQGVTPPGAPRAAPTLIPETKFRNQDDSLDSFMQDMVNGRAGSRGRPEPAPADSPGANAAQLGASVAAASATGPLAQAAAYGPRPRAMVLAMPPDPAHLPPPRPAPPLGSLEAHELASLGAQKALPPPPAADPILAGRAPGVVWGMPDTPPGPADGPVAMLAEAAADAGLPHSTRPSADPAPAERAPGTVWGIPDMTPGPTDGPLAMLTDAPPDAGLPPHSPPAPREATLTGRAPGVVWGIPDTAPARAAGQTTQLADVETAQRDRSTVGRSSAPVHGVPPAPEPSLAGRAPGVIWGMPDMAPAPTGLPRATPTAGVVEAAPLPRPAKPVATPAEMVLAGQAGTPASTTPPARQPAPPAPAPAKPARPGPAETFLAGPASAPVEADAERAGAAAPAPTTLARAPLPAPAKPIAGRRAPESEPARFALAEPPIRRPVPVAETAGIEVGSGLVSIDASPSRDRAAPLGSIPFHPESAMLTPDAVILLAEFLNAAAEPAARIRIVGEGSAPGLALDRARAVGLALVQGGVAADRLELTLAQGGSGDQARLFLAAPEL